MARVLRYVTTDAMGSVTSVLSSTGEVLERRSYDAFGQMTCMLPDGTPVATSPTGLKVGFHGQLMDQLTGMYQMGYRWYSPVLGRWASRDPIGLEGGVNLVGAFGNNALMSIDPLGTCYSLQDSRDIKYAFEITENSKSGLLVPPSPLELSMHWFTRRTNENDSDDPDLGIPNYVRTLGALNKVLIARWSKEASDWMYKHEGFLFVACHGCRVSDRGGSTQSVMVNQRTAATITSDEAISKVQSFIRAERARNKPVKTIVLLSCFAGENGLAQRLGLALRNDGIRVLATSEMVYVTDVNPTGQHMPRRRTTVFPVASSDPIHRATDEATVRNMARDLIFRQQAALSNRLTASPSDGFPIFEIYPKQ
jgi:RHS repeat-associated protein